MANTIPREEIGGGIHVRDCYVWTEISYLDSSSDFREYLPQDAQAKPHDDRLDSPGSSARKFSCPLISDALAGLAVVAITILTICFFYILVDL